MKRLGIFLTLAGVVLSMGTAQALDLAGKASIGASGGIITFLSGEEWGQGELRFSGQGAFKYNFTHRFAAVVESGFGWNSYARGDLRPEAIEGARVPDTDDDNFVGTVVPTTLGVQYRFPYSESLLPYVGAGFGLYALGVKDTPRNWYEEPTTGERLTWTSPGVYFKLGGEILFESGAAINIDFLYHAIFSESDNFPQAWGENTSFGQFRVGGAYYFNLTGKASGAVPEGE